MTNLAILFDDTDTELGQYFTNCFQDVGKAVIDANIIIKSINSQNSAYINQIIGGLENLIFVGFTHGSSDNLGTQNGSSIFIDSGNAHLFSGSIFYTTACSCGEKLGKTLIQKGVKVFIGYNDVVNISNGFEEIFIKCENYGIKEFLNSSKSWYEIMLEIKKVYEEEADKLFDEGGYETLAGLELIQSRDKLCLLGDGSLRFPN